MLVAWASLGFGRNCLAKRQSKTHKTPVESRAAVAVAEPMEAVEAQGIVVEMSSTKAY